MKKRIMVMFAIVFYLSLSGVPIIAEAGVTGSADVLIAKKIIGEVTGVDLQSKTISAKQGYILFNVTLDDKTTIRKEKEIKTINDIKTGQKVTIMYFEVGGKNVAKSIRINP
jgi:Cu/Ag efflux protein CusF